jgi:RNA polymerase sigma-70 factor (ECF subfamily)
MDVKMSLVNAARMLDRDALVNLFDLYSLPLYNYAFRMCSDAKRADRIVGDAFAGLLKRLSGEKEAIKDLRFYLYKVTYQLIMEEQSESELHGAQENSLQAQQDCWNELTVEQRHVVILRYLERLSRSQTAAIMGKKSYQVKTLEYRAIDILLKTMGAQEAM